MARVILSEQKPLVTIDDFLETYDDIESPHAKHSIKFLQEQGALPLAYTSHKLLDLNVLAAWLFWSGSISDYLAHIEAKPQFQSGINQIAESMELGIRSEATNVSAFSKNGRYYARLLAKLGVYNSTGSKETVDRKVDHPINLPPYVMFLADHYHNLRREDKQIANKILAYQCRVLMWTRGHFDGPMYAIPLIANSESEANVERLAQQVLEMFNAIYPNIGLNKSSIRMYYHKTRGNYYSCILFQQENVINATRAYGLFEIVVNSEYPRFGRV